MESRRPSTYKQILKLRILSEDLGLDLSQSRERRLRKMSFDEVSRQIDQLEWRLEIGGSLKTRQAIAGMASNGALRNLFRLRDRAHNPVKADERTRLMAASVAEIQEATQKAQRELQDYNDSRGVPVPQWRVRSGLVAPDVLERNGIAGVPKVKRMTFAELQAAVRASAPAKLPES